jgi:hypothetical protein
VAADEGSYELHPGWPAFDSTGGGNDEWARLKPVRDVDTYDDNDPSDEEHDEDPDDYEPAGSSQPEESAECGALTPDGGICSRPVNHPGPCDARGASRPKYSREEIAALREKAAQYRRGDVPADAPTHPLPRYPRRPFRPADDEWTIRVCVCGAALGEEIAAVALEACPDCGRPTTPVRNRTRAVKVRSTTDATE